MVYVIYMQAHLHVRVCCSDRLASLDIKADGSFRHSALVVWEVHVFAYKPLMYVYMYFELQYVA